MLNPVYNAKVLGLIIGFYGVLVLLLTFLSVGLVTSSGGNILNVYRGFIYAALSILTGYGLFQTKRWSIYLLGLIAALSVFPIITGLSYYLAHQTSFIFQGIIAIILSGSFIWFYLRRSKFS